MKLDGLHHITMITGDAQRNVDFYADLLGLRLVKTTVNFDAPEAYHLYFGDEIGSARFDPHVVRVRRGGPRPRGRGNDPHHRTRACRRRGRSSSGRPACPQAGVQCERGDGTLRFSDYDGLALRAGGGELG